MPKNNKEFLNFLNEQALALHSTLVMLTIKDKEKLFEKFAEFTEELTNTIKKELKDEK